MTKYRQIKEWLTVEKAIKNSVDNENVNTTDYIDYCLLIGGPIKDVHNKIHTKQLKDKSSKLYGIGQLLNKNGQPQQRTLFGHIAYLITQEGLEITFGNRKIDFTESKKELEEKYNKNLPIKITGLRLIEKECDVLNGYTSDLIPEEINEDTVIFEGTKKSIVVNAYERSQRAKEVCLNEKGTKCVICEFDFEKKYGELGLGYIHVHHIVPLSQIGEKYELDPKKDLVPVCPNCHAMLHKKKPPYSVKELMELISQQGA